MELEDILKLKDVAAQQREIKDRNYLAVIRAASTSPELFERIISILSPDDRKEAVKALSNEAIMSAAATSPELFEKVLSVLSREEQKQAVREINYSCVAAIRSPEIRQKIEKILGKEELNTTAYPIAKKSILYSQIIKQEDMPIVESMAQCLGDQNPQLNAVDALLKAVDIVMGARALLPLAKTGKAPSIKDIPYGPMNKIMSFITGTSEDMAGKILEALQTHPEMRPLEKITSHLIFGALNIAAQIASKIVKVDKEKLLAREGKKAYDKPKLTTVARITGSNPPQDRRFPTR